MQLVKKNLYCQRCPDPRIYLHTYIFSDGGNNKFRFALDEGDAFCWSNHEVSQWFRDDWIGRRVQSLVNERLAPGNYVSCSDAPASEQDI